MSDKTLRDALALVFEHYGDDPRIEPLRALAQSDAQPVAGSDARLRGIASDYFPDAKDWPAAMLCLRHLLMEQVAASPQKAQPTRGWLSDAVKAGWSAALECHAQIGMSGWSSHRDRYLARAIERIVRGEGAV